MPVAEKTHTLFKIICLRTATISEVPLTDGQLSGKEKILCPKSSLPAIPLSFAGTTWAMPEIFRRLVAIENRLFDLEASLDGDEER